MRYKRTKIDDSINSGKIYMNKMRDLTKIYSTNTVKIVKEKEIHASFSVAPQSAKVIAKVFDK